MMDFVNKPKEYKYSMTIDNAGQKGVLANVVVFQFF